MLREEYIVFIQSKERMMFLKLNMNCTAKVLATSSYFKFLSSALRRGLHRFHSMPETDDI
jgi:hypothetical protein